MVMVKTSCSGNTEQKYWSTPVQVIHECKQEKNLTSDLKKLMLSTSTNKYLSWKALFES